MSFRLMHQLLLSLPLLTASLYAVGQTNSNYSFSPSQFCTLDELGDVSCIISRGYERLAPPDNLPSLGALTTGETHACGITLEGQPVCWGDNYYGQLNTPTVNAALVQIDAGANQTCAVDTNAESICWGLNDNLQLDAPEGEKFLQVDTGSLMTCGLKLDGEVTCWSDDERRYPRNLVGPFVKIDLRSGGVCGLTNDGEIRCSDNSMVTPSITPYTPYLAPPSNGPYIDMSATYNAVCGLKTDGSLDCTFVDAEDASSYPLGEQFAKIKSNDTDILHSTREFVDGRFTYLPSGTEMCGQKMDGSFECWDEGAIFAGPTGGGSTNTELVASFELELDAKIYDSNSVEIFWTPLPSNYSLGGTLFVEPVVEIYRNGELIESRNARFSYFDGNAEINSEYQIRLIDEAGIPGPFSDVLAVNTIERTVLFNGEPTLIQSQLAELPDVFTSTNTASLFVGIVVAWEVNSDVESLIDGYEIRVNGSPAGFTRSNLFVDTNTPLAGRCVEIIAVGFDQARLGAKSVGSGCS